jgi:hypothetical protein
VGEDVAGLPAFRRNHPPQWLTDAQIRRALRSGDLVVRRRGVLIGRRRLDWDPPHVVAIQEAIAGLRRGSRAYACLGSAAQLHGISRLGRAPRRVRLYREHGGPWRDEDVAVLVCSLPPEHLTVVGGVPATTAARTAVDLGRWVTLRSAVVVVDSTMRLGVSRDQLDEVIVRCRRWPGIRNARAAVAFADPRAASPLESISRVVFRRLGVPAPDLQVPLGPDPDWPVGVVDFYWPEFGVIGEADGLLKYDDEEDEPRALRAEKLRQENLEALGYIVVRWTWDDIWRRPEWVVLRIRRAMAEGARRRIA